jgi:hypothetical protein
MYGFATIFPRAGSEACYIGYIRISSRISMPINLSAQLFAEPYVYGLDDIRSRAEHK